MTSILVCCIFVINDSWDQDLFHQNQDSTFISLFVGIDCFKMSVQVIDNSIPQQVHLTQPMTLSEKRIDIFFQPYTFKPRIVFTDFMILFLMLFSYVLQILYLDALFLNDCLSHGQLCQGTKDIIVFLCAGTFDTANGFI